MMHRLHLEIAMSKCASFIKYDVFNLSKSFQIIRPFNDNTSSAGTPQPRKEA